MLRNLKVSKNVTFELDNLMVIQQLMARTKRNFSQTVNILIKNWVTMNKIYEEQKQENEEQAEKHRRELREKEIALKQATPIKEV